MAAEPSLPCGDFNLFNKVLYELRKVDDAVVTELNDLTPTASFRNQVNAAERCIAFSDMLKKAHEQRDAGINQCINEISQEVLKLKQELHVTEKDQRTMQGKGKSSVYEAPLRKAQTTLRQLKTEAVADKILQEQTLKVVKDHCARFLRTAK